MQKPLLNWLTLLLLLVGQSQLLAHQADLDAHHDQAEDCVICHVGNGLDVSVSFDAPLFTSITTVIQPGALVDQGTGCNQPATARIRAPPSAPRV